MESYARENELSGGDVVDRSGKVLGRHSGIHGVTIGQRRGLGISASRPLYVVDIEEESKRVVVGTKEELGCKGLIAGNINWIESFDEGEIAAEVQIRYRSPAIPCVVRRTVEGTFRSSFHRRFSRGYARAGGGLLSWRSVIGGRVDHASDPLARGAITNLKCQISKFGCSEI